MGPLFPVCLEFAASCDGAGHSATERALVITADIYRLCMFSA
jgi:hypothetical protein